MIVRAVVAHDLTDLKAKGVAIAQMVEREN